MRTPKLRPLPPVEELRDGYTKAVTQGLTLLEGAIELAPKRAPTALALAQIGQEEIGKSLSLLAAIGLPSNSDSGKWFWNTWTHHRTKAHRAFLYELICPTRIELHMPNRHPLAGHSLRKEIQHEKESGFYVNFDSETGRFRSPAEDVSTVEAFHRVTTLLYLGVVAQCIHDALAATQSLNSHRVFSEVAFRVCSENLYQQEMPALLSEFSQRSPQHGSIISQVNSSLAAGTKFLTDLIQGKNHL